MNVQFGPLFSREILCRRNSLYLRIEFASYFCCATLPNRPLFSTPHDVLSCSRQGSLPKIEWKSRHKVTNAQDELLGDLIDDYGNPNRSHLRYHQSARQAKQADPDPSSTYNDFRENLWRFRVGSAEAATIWSCMY